MTFNFTAAAGILKDYYTDDRVLNMIYQRNPFLQKVEVMTDFTGNHLPVPVTYAPVEGRSATIGTAITNALATNSQVARFQLLRGQDYSVAYIDRQTMLATADNAGAFIAAATLEIDNAIIALKRSIAQTLFRSGYGDVGQIDYANTVVSSNVIYLALPSDVVNFEIGMRLVAAATLTGVLRTAPSNGAGSNYVTAIDRSAGTVTMNSNLNDSANGIGTNIANGDILFVQGDRASGASPGITKFPGLAGWLPSVAPVVGGGDSFFQVDRSADPTRLAGSRINGTNEPLEDVLIDTLHTVALNEGNPDTVFCSYNRHAQLVKALSTRGQIFQRDTSPTLGYGGFEIAGPNGIKTEIIPELNCPDNRIYCLSMDTWKLYSLGPLVAPVNEDGLEFVRVAGVDSFEWRWASYAVLGCRAPAHNAVILV